MPKTPREYDERKKTLMKEDTIKLVKRAIKGNMDAYGKLIAEYQIYLYKTAFLYPESVRLIVPAH